MRDIENATLNKMKYDNMKKQAECYAKATGQTLPDNLSYNDLETISIRCFLPQYTRGEDLSSAISHIIGGALGIIMLIVGIYYSVVTTKPYFGVGEIYTFSHPAAIATMFIFALGAICYLPLSLGQWRKESIESHRPLYYLFLNSSFLYSYHSPGTSRCLWNGHDLGLCRIRSRVGIRNLVDRLQLSLAEQQSRSRHIHGRIHHLRMDDHRFYSSHNN